jgi:hypothetical protein
MNEADCGRSFSMAQAHAREQILWKFANLSQIFPEATAHILQCRSPFCDFLRNAKGDVVEGEFVKGGPLVEGGVPLGDEGEGSLWQANGTIEFDGGSFSAGSAACLVLPGLGGGFESRLTGCIASVSTEGFRFELRDEGGNALPIPLRALEYGLVRLEKL